MSSPAGLHLQDLILDTKATATKEQKAEAVSEQVGGRYGANGSSEGVFLRFLLRLGVQISSS